MNIKECEDRHRQNISCGKCPLMIKGSYCEINDIIRSRFDCPFVWGKSTARFEFTKGRWTVVHSCSNLFSTIHSENGIVIAEVKSYVKERIANARLIAAAPELLEALVNVKRLSNLPGLGHGEEILLIVKEAIKKAI